MSIDDRKLEAALAAARAQGRDALTEPEGVDILRLMGLRVPASIAVRGSSDVDSLAPMPGDRVVVKVVSPQILHKTEAGGVAIVANDRTAIRSAIADMETRFGRYQVDGYTVNEYVRF